MRKNNTIGIYCIENTINNKKYIGQSVEIENRWSKHRSELNKNKHDNDYLQKSWNKYGEKNFKFYVLECCNKEQLDERECYYIDLYNTLNENYGYNLKTGGQFGNAVELQEVKIKKSESLKKFYENNPEAKNKKSLDALKQWSNPEIKNKICGKNNGMYGKHHTDEAKIKISKANKGMPSHRRDLRPVYCIDLNIEFEHAVAAANALGIKSNLILQCCYGNRKTHGGHKFKFLDKENNIN